MCFTQEAEITSGIDALLREGKPVCAKSNMYDWSSVFAQYEHIWTNHFAKETIIYDGRWSFATKKGKIFRKYFRYGTKEDALVEGAYSTRFTKLGIFTPCYISTNFSSDYNAYFNDFEFVQMRTLTPQLLFDEMHWPQIEQMLACLGNVQVTSDDRRWEEKMLPSILSALKNVEKEMNIRIDEVYEAFCRMPKTTLVHGDFSLVNLFETIEGNMIVVDFQYACVGVSKWDKCYLLASMDIEQIPITILQAMTAEERKLTAMIALVRLGRGLRKQFEVRERLMRYQYWQQRSLAD